MDHCKEKIGKSERWKRVKQMICATRICTRGKLRDIKREISELTKDEAEEMYEDDHNLLHFAIIHNQPGIIEELFKKGLFGEYHDCTTMPYVHMACFYRHKDVVDVLVKCRYNNFYERMEEKYVKRYTAMFPPTGKNKDLHEQITAILAQEQLTALDIVSLYQDFELLKSIWRSLPGKNWLGETVTKHLPAVTAMLLASMEFDDSCFNDAFEKSLYVPSVHQLEMVLKHAAKKNVVFSQKNPYYILYRYSGCPESIIVREGFLEGTRLLIQYGFDVNVMNGPATFPLYTLLDYFMEEFRWSDSKDDDICCVRLLIDAGADPTFNEITAVCDGSELTVSSFEAENKEKSGTRLGYSSGMDALTCIFEHPYFLIDNLSWWKTVSEILTIFVEHGCYVNDDNQRILSVVCCCLGYIFAEYDCDEEICRLVRRIISTLLLLGADLHDCGGLPPMPLAVFTQDFLDAKVQFYMDRNLDENEIHLQLCRVKPVYGLFGAMGLDAVYEIINDAVKLIDYWNVGYLYLYPDAFREEMKDILNSHIRSVRSLYHQCMIKVWYCGHCKCTNLESLEIPSHVKADIIGLLSI